jgi:hypothetical protein
MAGKRRSVVELEQRRQEVLRMLGDGWGTSELTSHLTDAWGCSRRTARRAVNAGLQELVADLEPVQAAQMLASLVARAERIARKAEECGQYGAAIGAVRTLNELVVEPHRQQHYPRAIGRRW